jgi:hypothetical protein
MGETHRVISYVSIRWFSWFFGVLVCGPREVVPEFCGLHVPVDLGSVGRFAVGVLGLKKCTSARSFLSVGVLVGSCVKCVSVLGHHRGCL